NRSRKRRPGAAAGPAAVARARAAVYDCRRFLPVRPAPSPPPVAAPFRGAGAGFPPKKYWQNAGDGGHLDNDGETCHGGVSRRAARAWPSRPARSPAGTAGEEAEQAAGFSRPAQSELADRSVLGYPLLPGTPDPRPARIPSHAQARRTQKHTRFPMAL